MKRVLLTNAYGPYDLEWGENQLDILESRLQRGQGPFTLKSLAHCHALYLIAENINAQTTVLEHPHVEDYEEELRKGYDYVGMQLISVNLHKIAHMMRLAREIAPQTKIVIGGYGITGLYDPPPGETGDEVEYILKEADYLCREEGAQFMRKILGDEPIDRPISQKYLPRGSSYFPGYEKASNRSMGGTALVALGCPNGCEFCCTSAMFKKEKIYVTTPQETFEIMKHNCRRNGGRATSTSLMDEDLLLNHDYVTELGRLIQEDKEFGLSKLGYFCFGDLRSITEYSMEELLECGLDSIWVGVESSIDDVITSEHNIAKRSCDDVKSTFNAMEQYGIGITASMVLGWDFHTPENIEGDIDFFVDLGPSAYQMTFLTACPGTELYDRMKKNGRISPKMKFRDIQQCNDSTFIAKNFKEGELRDYFELAHKKLYETNGPGLFRGFQLNLNGYETCSQSHRPLLRNEKAALFAERCQGGVSMVDAVIKYGPTEIVREKAREAKEKYVRFFGEIDDEQTFYSDAFCNLVEGRIEELKKPQSEEPYDPPVWRTYYDPEAGPIPTIKEGRGPGDPVPCKIYDEPEPAAAAS
jgi:haloalkane dehalogenase